MLELSAAFETADHSMLLQWEEYYYSVMGKALSWLESYLSERSQFAKVEQWIHFRSKDYMERSSGVCSGIHLIFCF